MASLDTLPPDQRAVLQLVLQRGRSYGEIAQVLSIDTAAVRQRALSALEALGPSARTPPERREEISDYLLGQLPAAAAERARGRIAGSPPERAWARVVASELAPLAATPLPEIPTEPDADESEPEPRPEPAQEPVNAGTPTEPVAAGAAPPATDATGAHAADGPGATGPEPPPEPRPSSRRGGAILLAVGALVAVAVVAVIVLVAGGGSSKKHTTTTTAAGVTRTTAAGATTTNAATTSTTTPTAQPIAQVNLVSPTHSKRTVGIAEIIRQGTKTGLVIVAQGIPANTNHDAYAVWLYNSQSDSHLLGFVNPGVKTDGKLQTAGPLPANVAHFKHLLVTLETQAKPHGPGKVILEGALGLGP
jgi:hypothetical protein